MNLLFVTFPWRRLLPCLLALLIGVSVSAQRRAGALVPADEVKRDGVETFFTVAQIDSALLRRMQQGGSYPKGCAVPVSELRYLRVLHYNFQSQVQVGELVCNKAIAADLLDIFRKLYDAHYPIFRMVLIDEYGADDEASMSHNNTSCFCYRRVAGSTKMSMHSRGLAIDINPLNNPCVHYTQDGKVRRVQPNTEEARQYIKRTAGRPYIITPTDLCYKLFHAKGFTWGGNWRTVRDYQHFEKK